MKYLIDSDWLIDARIGIPNAVRTLDRLSVQGLGVSIVTVAEVYEGAFGSPDPPATLAAWRDLLRPYTVLPLSDPIAERLARLRALLRKQGNRIPDLDLLIAATALHHDLTLVTRNRRHFARVPDLRRYEPVSTPEP